MSVLVVGVGGLGRGVCNWLKHRLETEYGSVAASGFELLVIDGPVKDTQYNLPGGYEIDTSSTSPEYYGPRELPGPAIKQIAAGGTYPWVDQWLVRTEAQSIPNPDQIVPENGYGQIRPAGRVGFFLEADKLSTLLGAKCANQSQIVLVGSQAGGTGSGMLLDVAQLIRKHKPATAYFHGYLGLPTGFRAVFNDAASRASANTRAFAGLRELERMRISPTPVQYTAALSVANRALFDGVFLVDGSRIPADKAPVYGTAPLVADHIFSLYASGLAGTAAAGWQAMSVLQQANRPDMPGYWTPGVFTCLYEWRSVQESFALKFARDVYDALLTVAPQNANLGEQLATTVLSSTGPGSLALEYSRVGALAISWPIADSQSHTMRRDSLSGLQRLRDHFNTSGNGNSSGPLPPFARLIDLVDVHRMLRPVENSDIPPQCVGVSRRHIGSPTDAASPNTNASLWAWAKYQHEIICRQFISEVAYQLESLFWDSNLNQWRALSVMPYSLVIARDLLEQCREKIRSERTYIENERASYKDQKTREQAADAFEAARKALLNAPRRRDVQSDFIEGVAQWCHCLDEWDVLTQAYVAVLSDMLALTDDLWMKIGSPADSWLGYLEHCRSKMNESYNDDLSNRQVAAREVHARRYVPEPGGPAENDLYRHTVEQTSHVNSLLSSLRWEFKCTSGKGAGQAFASTVGARDIAKSYDCYLRVPNVPGYSGEVRPDLLYDGKTGAYRQTLVRRHEPEMFIQVGRNNCEAPLRAMSIWDVMELEAASQKLDPAVYAKQVQDLLAANSQASLNKQGSATPQKTVVQIARHNVNSPISTQVDQALSAIGVSAVPLPAGTHFDHSVAVLLTEYSLRLTDWSEYTNLRTDYYKNRGNAPVHCYAEERHATDGVEEYLLNNNFAALDEMPLHHSVCRYLGDWKLFEAFAVSFLLRDLPQAASPMAETSGGPNAKELLVTNCISQGGHQTQCNLGLACSLDSVLSKLTNPSDVLSTIARNRLLDYVAELPGRIANTPGLDAVVRSGLQLAKPADVQLPPLDTTNSAPERLDREHLQWALWAAGWRFCQQVLGL